jgi:hypothetical protein
VLTDPITDRRLREQRPRRFVWIWFLSVPLGVRDWQIRRLKMLGHPCESMILFTGESFHRSVPLGVQHGRNIRPFHPFSVSIGAAKLLKRFSDSPGKHPG